MSSDTPEAAAQNRAEPRVSLSLIDAIVCTTVLGISISSGFQAHHEDGQGLATMARIAVFGALAGGIAFGMARRLQLERGQAAVAGTYVPVVAFGAAAVIAHATPEDFTGMLVCGCAAWLVTAVVLCKRARIPLLPCGSIIGTVYFFAPFTLMLLMIAAEGLGLAGPR